MRILSISSLFLLAALQNGDPIQLTGRVKSVLDDGSGFLAKTRKGTIKVLWQEESRVTLFEVKPLVDLEDGTRVYVLGRRQDSVRDPVTQVKVPAQIIQISAVFAGQFEPPAIPKKLKDRKLTWIQGQLGRRDDNSFRLDRTAMQIGRSRSVTVVKAAEKGVIEKKQAILLVGDVDKTTKPKELRVQRVLVLDRRIPRQELLLLTTP